MGGRSRETLGGVEREEAIIRYSSDFTVKHDTTLRSPHVLTAGGHVAGIIRKCLGHEIRRTRVPCHLLCFLSFSTAED